MARRSAIECAAVFDLLGRFGAAQRAPLDNGREMLLRIVSMLVRLTTRRTDRDDAHP
ncbi:MAG: hypothetical protein ABI629_25800 [bacterium]